MKNVLTSLAKNVLLVAVQSEKVQSEKDAAIEMKIYGSGMTTLIILNKEMKDIIERVKYLEESCLLNEGVKKLK